MPSRTNSTPDAPGPPGFSSSDPIRSPGLVAAARMSEMFR
jgi:hypothetical protein